MEDIKLELLKRGYLVAPGEAVDYRAPLFVNVRWGVSLIASPCEGGGVCVMGTHSQPASVFLLNSTSCTPLLFSSPSLNASFNKLLCFLFPAVTRCPAGGRWRTPGWSVRKTTSTSASCACALSWTTRSALCTACARPSGLMHAVSDWSQIQFVPLLVLRVSFIMERNSPPYLFRGSFSCIFHFAVRLQHGHVTPECCEWNCTKSQQQEPKVT